MESPPNSARYVYLDTLMCSVHREKLDSDTCTTSEQESEEEEDEFISGLAPNASPSTTTPARRTGGKRVCIVPEPKLDQSQKKKDKSGLKDMVELKTSNGVHELANYRNMDFSLVDWKSEVYKAGEDNHLREGVGKRDWRRVKRVRSMKLSLGQEKGIDEELPLTRKGHHSRSRSWGSGNSNTNSNTNTKTGASKSKWVTKIDALTGETHIFRITKSDERNFGCEEGDEEQVVFKNF